MNERQTGVNGLSLEKPFHSRNWISGHSAFQQLRLVKGFELGVWCVVKGYVFCGRLERRRRLVGSCESCMEVVVVNLEMLSARNFKLD